MEVLNVLQQKPPDGLTTAAQLPQRAMLLVWSLVVADVATVAWMLSAGEWLDRASPILAVATLGGHHEVVLWFASAGFCVLALLIVLTGALTSVRRIHVPFVVAGALASTVAVCGTLSVALLVVGSVLLVALVCTALVGGRVVLLRGSLRR